MGILATMIQLIPNHLANWTYPRLLKGLMNSFYTGGVVNVHDVANDLVAFGAAAGTYGPDTPEYAFQQIVMTGLSEMGVTLTQAEVAPLAVLIGEKILADTDYAVVVPPTT